MKRALLFLIMISVLFAAAQSGPTAIKAATSELCQSSSTLLATTAMLFVLPIIPLLLAGIAIMKVYKGESKGIKLIGKLALGAAVLFFALAILAAIIYVFVPSIVSALTGMPLGGPGPCVYD